MDLLQERERGRREGVTLEANLPFLLEPAAPAGAGILLVHGFAASPREVRTFAEVLAESGMVALAVRLPGHGTSPEDLAGRRGEEWLETVAEGYRLLADRGLRVYGLGVSTGALLLLQLAARRPLAGLVLLSPFLRLHHPLAPLAAPLSLIRDFYEVPATPAEAPWYYRRRPLYGIYQLNRLCRRVRRLLPEINTPVLAMSGEGDQTVDVASAFALVRALGSTEKEYHLFGAAVPHVLCTEANPRWREALALTRRFLETREKAFETTP